MSGTPDLVLLNMNAYLGGGETLMVRFAQYLQDKGRSFICVCDSKGYIYSDLQRKGIPLAKIVPISKSPDFYYLSEVERKKLLEVILTRLEKKPYRFISFCMRDLYTVTALTKNIELASITHLILHIQDDHYLGQTVFEKLLYLLTKRRRFTNLPPIQFNRELIKKINQNGGLICMAELISDVWSRNFGIAIPRDHIIPLPSFVEEAEYLHASKKNKHKIIWVGRIVDFKIPALCAMIDFLAEDMRYRLTIVGSGDERKILRHMDRRGVSRDRVNFMGEVQYSELPNAIRGHSIGYAMGTSLVEIARHRIPVVIALASYSHMPFKRSICGGEFHGKPKGCDGSDLEVVSQDEVKTTLANTIATIESDWDASAEACFEYARKNYAVNENFAAYEAIINGTKWLSEEEKIKIPRAPIVRKFTYGLARLFGDIITHLNRNLKRE